MRSQPDGRQKQPSPAATTMFYKIIPSWDDRLKLPCKFAEEHGNDLKTEAELIVPNGEIWKVGVKKSDDCMVWFGEGWKEFMKHYSICYGDLVMFEFIIGSSKFRVVIFRKDATEIVYPRNLHEQEHECDDDDDDDKDEDDDDDEDHEDDDNDEDHEDDDNDEDHEDDDNDEDYSDDDDDDDVDDDDDDDDDDDYDDEDYFCDNDDCNSVE